MATVLVVEDERSIREVLRRFLERSGCAVLTAATGVDALRLLEDPSIDLVLLDLGLPDIDGTDVLLEAAPRVPVIVLTARVTTQDRIQGLQQGATDYVVKPFSPTEVVLRVKAVLARTLGRGAERPERSFGRGRLTIDSVHHQVVMDGAEVPLTASEWALLCALAAAPGRAFSRAELINRCRGYEYAGYERSMDAHVKNLRHKLGDADRAIVETVTGVGYRLGLSPDA